LSLVVKGLIVDLTLRLSVWVHQENTENKRACYVCGYHGTMRSSCKVFTCEKEPGNATHPAGTEPITLPGVTS